MKVEPSGVGLVPLHKRSHRAPLPTHHARTGEKVLAVTQEERTPSE